MKNIRILPGAAGIIALTATLGLVDGQRQYDAESVSRGRITLVEAMSHIADDASLPGNRPDIKPGRPAYLVEIRPGDIYSELLIDAVTGRIL
jgi:hypothetical protein